MDRVACRASPNLALVKYWGKRPGAGNIPATPSLGLGLGGLETLTVVRPTDGPDLVMVDGTVQRGERYAAFFDGIRRRLRSSLRFEAKSRNAFPTGAGIASSSSGFAALALACARLCVGLDSGPDARSRDRGIDEAALSALARRGSASAARAVYGGLSLLPAGGRAALPLFPPAYWPELRIAIAVVATRGKEVSSRQAMEATRATSPYYRAWLRDAGRLMPEARRAFACRDLARLGRAMRLSYSRMHAASLAADPPILYWLPGTVALLAACAELRRLGIAAFETVDAGPQVKVLCAEADLAAVCGRLAEAAPEALILVARPGPAPELIDLGPGDPEPELGQAAVFASPGIPRGEHA